MRKTKRISAAVLALIIALGTTGCTGGGRTETTGDAASTDAAATTTTADPNADLEEEVDWENMAEIEAVDVANEEGTGPLYVSGQKAGVVKALCYYDLASTQPELAELLAERYGGTIETEVCTSGSAYFEKLGVLIASGDSPDIVRYDTMAHPHGTSKNMYTALDEWLDIDSPLWAPEKDVIESFNYLGKHYYYPSDVEVGFAIIYNKTLLEEQGMPDPMDMYFEGTWDWNSFQDLTAQWAQRGEDYIGFTGGSWSSMMFANTTGTKVIDTTGTEIINNLKDQNVQRTMDWLSDMKKQRYIGDGFVDPGQAFIDGKLLFLGMGLTWGYESAQESLFKNNIEGEIAAVPFPRDPNADRYYISSGSFGFLVPSGAKNIQGAVDWILCGRIYETDPEIIAADRAEKMYEGKHYYPKCPECKFNCNEAGFADSPTCPECNATRKEKYEPYYSERQLQVIDDMSNPEKFGLVFDSSNGFNDDFSALFTGGEESIFDGPIYYASSFTQLRDSGYNTVESYLQPYRDAMAEAAANS